MVWQIIFWGVFDFLLIHYVYMILWVSKFFYIWIVILQGWLSLLF